MSGGDAGTGDGDAGTDPDVPAERDERLIGGYAGRLLLASSIGWAMLQAGRLVLSPMLPTVQAELSLSNVEAGVPFTVMWGVYALLQYPSGRLSDRLSRKPLLVGGLVVAAAGFLLLGAAPDYPALLVGAVVVGLGAGLYPTTARALLSDLFVARRGQAFGLHTASGDTGGVLAAVVAAIVVGVSWRLAYPPVVVVLLLAAIAIHVWSDEPYAVGRVDIGIGETVRRLLGDPSIRWLLVAYVLFAVTWQSAVAFLPSFLRSAKGLPPEVATASFGALFVVGMLAKPTSGVLGDAVGRVRVAAAALALGAAALAVVLLADWTPVVVVAVLLFALGLMAYPPVMQAALMDAFPDASMGGDLGGMRTVYVGLGSLGPTAVGAIADVAGFGPAFAALVGCLLVASAVIVVVGR